MTQVFDRAWFRRHQRPLLAALNTPGLGRELRAALDVGRGRLVHLAPDAYVVAHGGRQYTLDARTGPTFARRLHAEYRPIWRLAHWFDQTIANPFAPALNLGFDTLTAYPNANVETVSVDGYAARHGVDETFAVITAGAGTLSSDGDTDIFGPYLAATATTNQYAQLRRVFLLFDTSALTASATISAATCSVWGITKSSGLGSTDFVLVGSTPASNTAIVDADYTQLGSTSFGAVTFAAFDNTNSVYTDVTVNGSGQAAISKTGVTKFGARLEWDRAGSFTGVWANDSTYYQINMADNASGTAKAPKLVVTYSLPGAAVGPFRSAIGARLVRA